MTSSSAREKRTARYRVLAMALPIMLANASVPLVGVVDTAVMGQMPEPRYIGAVAIGSTLFSSIFWLFGFLRMGTGGLVAQALGANEPNQIKLTVSRSMLLAVMIGLLLILFKEPLFSAAIHWINTTPEMRQLTLTYYSIRVYAAPATLMLYAIIGSLVGLQKMAQVMFIQLILNGVNIALTLGFFHWFEWGLRGVAWATVISEYLALSIGLILLLRYQPLSRTLLLNATFWAKKSWTQLIRINSDLFIRTLCLIIAFYWLTAASANFGETVLAANTLLIQLLHFMAHALDGFAHTAESLGGNAYGKRDRRQFILYTRTSTECALLTAAVFCTGYLFLGEILLRWMTSMEAVISLAQIYLPWLILAPLLSVWSFVLDGIFIGVTRSREMRNGMLISLSAYIVASLVFVPWLGNHGLWLSYFVLMLSRAITLGIRIPNILKTLDDQFRIHTD